MIRIGGFNHPMISVFPAVNVVPSPPIHDAGFILKLVEVKVGVNKQLGSAIVAVTRNRLAPSETLRAASIVG